VSDPNVSPSFDDTGQVDELALRRNRNRGGQDDSTEDDIGIENDLSSDDDEYDTADLSPYDDYADAVVIDDLDVEPSLIGDEDDEDGLGYDDDDER
jgi:hypothetical protein